MSTTTTPATPATTPETDPVPVDMSTMSLCLKFARTALARTVDPAVTADDIAMDMMVRVMFGETPSLTMARRMVADVQRSAETRETRETTGRTAGRVRRVVRSVAVLLAVQVARFIVDRGPALAVPTGGTGAVLLAAVTADRPVNVPAGPSRRFTTTDDRDRTWTVDVPSGPWPVVADVRDVVRHESAQRGRWTADRVSLVKRTDPRPVHVDGTAVRFATVVQAILADGPMSRPDVDTSRWSVKRSGRPAAGLRSERETTTGLRRFPADGPVTPETTAAHQIRSASAPVTLADRAAVRLIREPRVTRMLDKRNLYAARVSGETAATYGRDMTPSVAGVVYRTTLADTVHHRPAGGRGAVAAVAAALADHGTTAVSLAAAHAHQDGDVTDPYVRWSAALRDIGLPTGRTYRDALEGLVRSAVRHGRTATPDVVGRPVDVPVPVPVVTVRPVDRRPVDPAALAVSGVPAVTVPSRVPGSRWSERWTAGRDRGRTDVRSAHRDGTPDGRTHRWTDRVRWTGGHPATTAAGDRWVPATGWVV